jgi:hypothetical protein
VVMIFDQDNGPWALCFHPCVSTVCSTAQTSWPGLRITCAWPTSKGLTISLSKWIWNSCPTWSGIGEGGLCGTGAAPP